MNNKKKKSFHRCFTVLAVLLCLVACSITILAYEPLQTTNWIEEPTDDEFMVFVPDDFYSPEYMALVEIDFSQYDTVFISDDGTQIPILSDNQTKATCNHTYQSGYINTNHKKNSSGGCTYDVYQATVCTKCGYTKSKTYYNTISSTVCLH